MHVYLKKIWGSEIFAVMAYLSSIIIGYYIIPFENRSTYILYISIMTFSLVIVLVSQKICNRNIAVFLFFLAICIIACIMAFRHQTGIDDPIYKEIFDTASNRNLLSYFVVRPEEKGYLLLQYLFNRIFGGNYDLGQIATTFLTFILWGLAINSLREKINITIAIYILWTIYYFIIMYASLVRMFMATAIVMCAITYLLYGKWKKYILLICIASTVHISALIMLIFIFFHFNYEFIKNNLIKICIFLFCVTPVVFIIIITCIAPFLGMKHDEMSVSSFVFSIRDFNTLPLLLLVYLFGKSDSSIKNDKIYVLGVILCSITLSVSVFSSLGITLERLTYYGNLGWILLWGIICKNSYKRNILFSSNSIIVLYGFSYLMVAAFLQANSKYLFPYISIFSN